MAERGQALPWGSVRQPPQAANAKGQQGQPPGCLPRRKQDSVSALGSSSMWGKGLGQLDHRWATFLHMSRCRVRSKVYWLPAFQLAPRTMSFQAPPADFCSSSTCEKLTEASPFSCPAQLVTLKAGERVFNSIAHVNTHTPLFWSLLWCDTGRNPAEANCSSSPAPVPVPFEAKPMA